MDFAVTADHRRNLKERETIEKFKELAMDQKKKPTVEKVTMTPKVVVVLVNINKCQKKE